MPTPMKMMAARRLRPWTIASSTACGHRPKNKKPKAQREKERRGRTKRPALTGDKAARSVDVEREEIAVASAAAAATFASSRLLA